MIQPTVPSKLPKRPDLQGIRGLAIISVLGFHFYPSLFPNGYLGVDQFFVLSGFLMCMLLKRSETLPTFSLITLFYSKRFKRILPLYLLIIALSMIFLYSLFPDTAIENNQQSATKALLFVSNRPKTDQENYFQMLAIGVDIFTHTWSLSVEIQFYFLVPALFIFGNRFSYNFQFMYYILIGGISIAFHIFSTTNVAFNNVFARIWQFAIGMIVYLATLYGNEKFDTAKKIYRILENEEILDEKHEGELEKLMEEQNESVEVFEITLLTGLLMLISKDDKILSNKVLTYIGDVSYSLYLIHWPIYAYWKLTMNNNQAELFALLLTSIVLAIFMFETFETWYLKISSTSIGVLVVSLLILNVAMINKDIIHKSIRPPLNENHTRLDGLTDNMTMDDAIRLNAKWTYDDNKNLMVPWCKYIDSKGPLGWCEHEGLDKKSEYKIAIIGNSWTANHGNLFHQECHKKANRILQIASYGCEVFYPSDHSQRCADYVKTFEKHLVDFQPDYVFVFVRHFTTGDPLSVNATSLENDEIYQFMKKQMKKLTSLTKKKMYIQSPIPRIVSGRIGDIVPSIRKGIPLARIDNSLVDFTNYDLAVKRFNKLYKDCGEKCVPIDYGHVFYNLTSSTQRFYDERGFVFFTGANHLSLRGLEQLRSTYTGICEKL